MSTANGAPGGGTEVTPHPGLRFARPTLPARGRDQAHTSMYLRLGGRVRSLKEIQIAADVGLADVL